MALQASLLPSLLKRFTIRLKRLGSLDFQSNYQSKSIIFEIISQKPTKGQSRQLP